MLIYFDKLSYKHTSSISSNFSSYAGSTRDYSSGFGYESNYHIGVGYKDGLSDYLKERNIAHTITDLNLGEFGIVVDVTPEELDYFTMLTINGVDIKLLE